MSNCWRFLQLFALAFSLTACGSTTESTQKTSSSSGTNPECTASSGTGNSPKPGSDSTIQPGAGSHSKISQPNGVIPMSAQNRAAAMQAFAKDIAATRGLKESQVLAVLNEAKLNPTVIRIVTPPPPGQPRPARSWQTYRNRFVEPIRIRAGRAFIKDYQAELARAENRYGVPAEVIAAIIGVETLYGKQMGNFRVLDALYSLAFDYPDPNRPDRQEMFRNQLADLIELHLQGKLNALTLKGSYAGAIGIPQFMPGSIKRFALSAKGESGSIDLTLDTSDAIVSVANFLVAHGWQRGLPVFAPVVLPRDPKRLVDGGLTPKLDWTQLQAAGATLKPGATAGNWTKSALGVIDLPEEPAGTVEYRTATPNFFALTMYNRSYFYAAAVADLASALGR